MMEAINLMAMHRMLTNRFTWLMQQDLLSKAQIENVPQRIEMLENGEADINVLIGAHRRKSAVQHDPVLRFSPSLLRVILNGWSQEDLMLAYESTGAHPDVQDAEQRLAVWELRS